MPFLGKAIGGEWTWLVEIGPVSLADSCNDAALDNSYLDKFIVLLSPHTGEILRVTSVWVPWLLRSSHHPSVAEEEEQLRSVSVRYHGPPTVPPTQTFTDAIVQCPSWSSQVKQVIGYYVVESNPAMLHRAVWVVQLLGLPPMSWWPPVSDLGDLPSGATAFKGSHSLRNHIRNVIDAHTGELLYADSLPQPLLPVEDRY